jgi:hypothetical protein
MLFVQSSNKRRLDPALQIGNGTIARFTLI